MYYSQKLPLCERKKSEAVSACVVTLQVRPGGKLILQPGVTLRFPPSVGMMVAGKLEARGKGPNDIRLTLREERIDMPENDTDPALLIPEEHRAPVRLLGGRTSREGRLQVCQSYIFCIF